VLHFKNCKIDMSNILFLDELKALYPNRDDITETALVDHNQLDMDQEEWLGKNVTRVIDHHIDNECYKDTLVEKEVRFIGSACSLLALMFQKDKHLFAEDLAPSDEPNFAYLLAAAVVLDSYNFLESIKNKKWNDDDIVAHKFLAETADVGLEYWRTLNNAKFDSEAALELGMKGNMVRDYKKYDLGKGIMGCSVINALHGDMIGRYGEELLTAESLQHMKNDGLHMYLIIGMRADDMSNVTKTLYLVRELSADNELAKSFDILCSHLEGADVLNLNEKFHQEQTSNGCQYTVYNIQNTAVSRKVLEAIIKTFYRD